MRKITNRLAMLAAAVSAVAVPMQPSKAWVAVGRFYHPPVVVCHAAPCYAGVGAAAVVGFAAGAAVASANKPTVVVTPAPVVITPAPIIVTPPPTVVSAPPPEHGPAIGTAVNVLPAGAQALTMGDVHYYLFDGTWYRPYFGSNGVYYTVVAPP